MPSAPRPAARGDRIFQRFWDLGEKCGLLSSVDALIGRGATVWHEMMPNSELRTD